MSIAKAPPGWQPCMAGPRQACQATRRMIAEKARLRPFLRRALSLVTAGPYTFVKRQAVALRLLVLLMSGLQIFNVHPALKLGREFRFRPSDPRQDDARTIHFLSVFRSRVSSSSGSRWSSPEGLGTICAVVTGRCAMAGSGHH